MPQNDNDPAWKSARQAMRAFEQCADVIQARDHCDRVEALETAIREHPGEFAEYLSGFRRRR